MKIFVRIVKSILWLAVAVALVYGAKHLVTQKQAEKAAAPTLAAVPTAVEVTPVKEGRVRQTRHVLGTVLGADEAVVAPRIMAEIQDVQVREGDTVTKGQLLATLDPRVIEDAVGQATAGLSAAQAAFAAARTAYETQKAATARDRTLYEAKALAREQYDRSRTVLAASEAQRGAAQAQITVARRRLDEARTRLGYTRLKAPFDGVISARVSDPGDLGAPGKPVVKLIRDGHVRVRAELPSADFTDIHVGMALTITNGSETIEAKVSRVFPAMGRNHLAAFEADIPSPPPGLVSGTAVGVDVQLAGSEGLVVPIDALLEGDKGAFVFLVRDGAVHTVPVTVIGRSFDEVVVSGPIHAGDRVVTARPSRLMTLQEGVKVLVAGTESGAAASAAAPAETGVAPRARQQ